MQFDREANYHRYWGTCYLLTLLGFCNPGQKNKTSCDRIHELIKESALELPVIWLRNSEFLRAEI